VTITSLKRKMSNNNKQVGNYKGNNYDPNYKKQKTTENNNNNNNNKSSNRYQGRPLKGTNKTGQYYKGRVDYYDPMEIFTNQERKLMAKEVGLIPDLKAKIPIKTWDDNRNLFIRDFSTEQAKKRSNDADTLVNISKLKVDQTDLAQVLIVSSSKVSLAQVITQSQEWYESTSPYIIESSNEAGDRKASYWLSKVAIERIQVFRQDNPYKKLFTACAIVLEELSRGEEKMSEADECYRGAFGMCISLRNYAITAYGYTMVEMTEEKYMNLRSEKLNKLGMLSLYASGDFERLRKILSQKLQDNKLLQDTGQIPKKTFDVKKKRNF